jgi:hypothetical protein
MHLTESCARASISLRLKSLSPSTALRASAPHAIDSHRSPAAINLFKPALLAQPQKVGHQDCVTFRRQRHFHVIPGIPHLQLWEDPSRTGDHRALSRFTAPFALQFDHLSRVVGLLPASFLLGGLAFVIVGIGARQSIHSIILSSRVHHQLTQQRTQLLARCGSHTPKPAHLQALLQANSRDRRLLKYGMALDGSVTVGAIGVGIGTFFRLPLLGSVFPSLLPLAIPLLTAAFVPLVAPAAVTVFDRAIRIIYSKVDERRITAHLQQCVSPMARLIAPISIQRHREIRRYYLAEAAAFAGLVVGAGVSVFVGPGGLLLLVPATIGILVGESFAWRIAQVADAVPFSERLTLNSEGAMHRAILAADRDYQTLKRLRQARASDYPRGFGTSARPLLRLKMRLLHGKRAQNPLLKDGVFAAFRQRSALPAPTPSPQRVGAEAVFGLLGEVHVKEDFAKTLLKHSKLRAALRGQGVAMQGRRWTLDFVQLAAAVENLRQGTPAQTALAEEVIGIAECTLLTRGKTRAHRRLRALVDHYGSYVRSLHSGQGCKACTAA